VSVQLTSLERVVWPEAGFTKGQMVDYYTRAADALVRHLARRPVTLVRFPEGVDRQGWYQTQCRGAPEWIGTARIGTQDYCVIDDVAGVLWAVNRGTVELHPFLARAERLDEPTAVAFDLDPGPPADVTTCCDVALLLRDELAARGLAGFAKTSGSAGLHVFVPLGRASYDATKAFARAVAVELADRRPDLVVARKERRLRAGKVLVDWAQNDRTKSLVGAYSLRALPWPTVSTPLSWDEIEAAAAERRPERLTFLPDIALARLERFGDLFRPVLELEQTL
jgi:bifunctional non-homologous end joining protein LigD